MNNQDLIDEEFEHAIKQLSTAIGLIDAQEVSAAKLRIEHLIAHLSGFRIGYSKTKS